MLSVLTFTLTGAAAAAQGRDSLPFAADERLTYRVRVPKVKASGRGVMSVEGMTDVRGTNALVLRFALRAGLGPIKGIDETQSWLDPVRMASLRFTKHERHLLSKHSETIEMYPAERLWTADGTVMQESATDMPLDELSFMYYVRTLPLDVDSLSISRHFDPARNPTTVTVAGRETIETSAGTFRTVIIEMRVKDSRRYKGDGVIRLYLSDDLCRIPVRIESAMPVMGKTVLTLESHTYDGDRCAAVQAPKRTPSENP